MMYDQPPAITIIQAGEMKLSFECTSDGIVLLSFMDTALDCELMASQILPLFSIKMRNVETKEETHLTADTGWKSTSIEKGDNSFSLIWEMDKLDVRLHGKIDNANSSIYWNFEIENKDKDMSIWSAIFPQIGIADLSDDGCVFFPRGPGEVQKGLWDRDFRHQGVYPEPWTVMQFVSAYNRQTGLYIATHDPNASTKTISIESRTNEKSVVFTFEHPAENMGVGGNNFELSGHAVWQLLRGDWFDSAMIYKNWLKENARWYPKLGKNGRTDTPDWMKELCVWATTSGNAEQLVPKVKQFAEFLGVPVGFHWYNWHQIPFDNDYPHYFPVTDGFADGVQELQKSGVYVMPYINGRLWDTRDKGTEDYQFTSVALPSATKDENGEIYTESYGSVESDGSPVKFGVMCPTTELWQTKIRDICLRLIDEYKVNAVYIDQISAMSPRLCMDKTHGHPLGGGHWWVEGYWEMLQSIRDAIPKDRMLTSECNAEAYTKWLDGYLSWTWQYDGQVPAFPAVYAGAIQNFGRAYRGGETADIALKMKAGQQLVFGEQIGWIDPSIINQKENADFFRQVVRLRYKLREYFYAGEMLRPPSLTDNMPNVKADWQWAGEWWVTTDSVLTGAWKLEDSIVLIFVNVSDNDVISEVNFDLAKYGINVNTCELKSITADGESQADSSLITNETTFFAHQAVAWKIKAK
ncbi:TPA: hypothetical protein ENS27_02055 [bacterium]|nr:hypothetical protein [bacterium]